jgi:hypothetical protein
MPESTQHPPAAQHSRTAGRPPTVRQIYAIARALCAETGEVWPRTSEDASTLIARLRGEEGSAG